MKNSIEKIIQWFIERLGGFVDIDDYLESVNADETHYILTRAVKSLYNTIDKDDILKEDPVSGQWMAEGKLMSDAEKNLLIAEAEQLLTTKLWEVLNRDIKYQANRKMFLHSKSDQDLIAGKLWTLTLDVFNQRLRNMVKKRGLFNTGENQMP